MKQNSKWIAILVGLGISGAIVTAVVSLPGDVIELPTQLPECESGEIDLEMKFDEKKEKAIEKLCLKKTDYEKIKNDLSKSYKKEKYNSKGKKYDLETEDYYNWVLPILQYEIKKDGSADMDGEITDRELFEKYILTP